ncbi:MAG TPA: thioredoxin domain-containing protein [Polyangiaceae bacterium]|nr:thioredoxin domain-containing protein [Polyangiaceae bacterium]
MVILLILALVPLACAAKHAGPGAANAGTPATSALAAAPAPELGDSGPIPVDDQSPRWGDDAAPVTLVEFSDIECPFCGRVQPTLAALQQRYGPHRLRVVWKHDPLPFHPNARPAALAAEAVRELAGNDAFFRFIALLFQDQRHLAQPDLRRAAVSLGVDGTSFDLLTRSPGVSARVDADLELASRVGANGTPHFLINGDAVSGAVPLEDFVAVVEHELDEARALTAHGAAPASIYALRTKANFKAPEAAPADDAPSEKETAWNVPVGSSPRLGPDDALVTIVEFSDFQCPFCKRVQPTLDAIRERYGKDVRIVWKHLPLPFHPRARPAATVSIEARKKLGDAGFWKAEALLFDSSPKLEQEDLQRVAHALGLDWTKTEHAILTDADASVIAEDEGTSVDFEAHGTPHFFVNGNRLVGAQPLEAFTPLIDAELDRAKKLLASGMPRARVYDELMRGASSPPPPEQKTVPAPTAVNPTRGPANAPVTIQMFADFECPYCRRGMKTIEELERLHPNQIRLVYRNLPLEFHPGAQIAASAALEAYAQHGADAFWKMATLLESDQDDPAPLTRNDLVSHATTLGLDVTRFEKALDDKRHQPVIDADVKLAEDLDIKGTPSFVINGYFVPGAQPFAVFERAVQRGLSAKPAPVLLRAK